VPKVRKGLEIGGIVAAVVLIVFGVVSIAMGVDGRDTVTTSIERENIVGTPDMTPSAIAAEAKEAGLPASVELPSCDVANQPIDSGDNARCFASYMRIHALEATGGYTYAEMGRYEAKSGTPKGELAPGGGTENEKFAVADPETGEPAENGARNVWVTETALSTALNTSYMADRLSLFGIVIGIALLLTGIGFAVLVAFGAVGDPDTVLKFLRSHKPHVGHRPAESH
jgi:putative Mn2+ efflux pump MntP